MQTGFTYKLLLIIKVYVFYFSIMGIMNAMKQEKYHSTLPTML